MHPMTRYIIRRLLITIPVFFGITLLVFTGVALAPGDPILTLISFEVLQEATPQEIEQIRHNLGLDQPIPIRYAKWLKEFMTGNLGISLKKRAPVSELLGERILNTLRLSVVALLLGLVIGVISGILMALNQYTWLDYALGVFTLAQWSTPPFFVGLAAIYLFTVKLGWLPAFGMYTPGQPSSIMDQFRHIIMPASILGLYGSATWARYTRASMLDALHSEYVTTARAKGLKENTIILRHVAKNAAMPVITVLGLSIPGLLAGAVIVETIFAWPGMGSLSVSATMQRDYPLLMGCVSVAAFMVLASNLVTDIAYAFVDPRIKYD
jgi:peptide/nickel transport system permease protein